MDMNDVRTVMVNLPGNMGGFTVSTPDGYYTIILNQNLSYEQNQKSYMHEIRHIKNGDYDKQCVSMIEFMAHRKDFEDEKDDL